MVSLTATPCYIAGIGYLQLIDDGHRCDVFVTTGAIEKLSRSPADDLSLTSTATAFEEIARRKLRDGLIQNDRVWIRSLDVPEWA
ncbi:hypothetical protein DEM27_22010 [Metarhizobium album]|uniref:DUF1488 domain-containing protein n=1 Tax=Metarhizobium album TaxID=2182425 RepID=A0A2U2DL20_9HYPH|nr:hypothetical protein [Rhizobium album]PWE54005.1 hypothetical protein DEM27_22010 [Rhizobium album]